MAYQCYCAEALLVARRGLLPEVAQPQCALATRHGVAAFVGVSAKLRRGLVAQVGPLWGYERSELFRASEYQSNAADRGFHR